MEHHIRTIRICTQCGNLVEFKSGVEPISLCRRCSDTLMRTECRTFSCENRRAPGSMFCTECITSGAQPVRIDTGSWFSSHLRAVKIPESTYMRMSPEARMEIMRDFAGRTTIRHVRLNRWPRINWPELKRRLAVFGNAASTAAMMLLAVIAAWVLAVLILGFAPGNEGVTFGPIP